MSDVTGFWPLLCGMQRYDKSLSTWGRNAGVNIDAPVLAYLIETKNGRLLYGCGCHASRTRERGPDAKFLDQRQFLPYGLAAVSPEEQLDAALVKLGVDLRDIDAVICGTLHFDHAGGLHTLQHADVHVHQRELAAMCESADAAYCHDDFAHGARWNVHCRDYEVVPGVHVIETPGHTAGHMSLLVEMPRGRPVVLCGGAADLQENLDGEIAPGLCWHNSEALALVSLRRLKELALAIGAELWPGRDMAFFHSHNAFPAEFSAILDQAV